MKRRAEAAARLATLCTVVLVLVILLGPRVWPSLEDAGNDLSGPQAVIAMAALYAVLTVAMLPGTLGTYMCGAVLGWQSGLLAAMGGATAGAAMAFSIGRRIAGGAVNEFLPQRFEEIERRISRNGFRAVVGLRLLPIVPSNGLNYAASVTSISMRSFLLGTFIGIIPGTVITVVAASHTRKLIGL